MQILKEDLVKMHQDTAPWIFHKEFGKWLEQQEEDSEETIKQVRTATQNRSLHKYLANLAGELDRNGFTMQDVLKAIRRAEIRPTMIALKEVVWKPLQLIVAGTDSTTKVTTSEIDRIVDTITKWTAYEFDGIYVPFPSKETKPYEYPTYTGEPNFETIT